MGILNRLLPKVSATTPASTIVFFARVDKDDWDETHGAWRCPVLKLPGVKVGEIRHAGQKQDNEHFRVDFPAHEIFWLGGKAEKPDSIALRIEMVSTLVTSETAADVSERTAVRVASISAVAIVVAAAITGITGYYIAKTGKPSNSNDVTTVPSATAGTIADKTVPNPSDTSNGNCVVVDRFIGELAPGASTNHFSSKGARRGPVHVTVTALSPPSNESRPLSLHSKVCDVAGHCEESGLVDRQEWRTSINSDGLLKFEVYSFPGQVNVSYDILVKYGCP